MLAGLPSTSSPDAMSAPGAPSASRSGAISGKQMYYENKYCDGSCGYSPPIPRRSACPLWPGSCSQRMASTMSSAVSASLDALAAQGAAVK